MAASRCQAQSRERRGNRGAGIGLAMGPGAVPENVQRGFEEGVIGVMPVSASFVLACRFRSAASTAAGVVAGAEIVVLAYG